MLHADVTMSCCQFIQTIQSSHCAQFVLITENNEIWDREEILLHFFMRTIFLISLNTLDKIIIKLIWMKKKDEKYNILMLSVN